MTCSTTSGRPLAAFVRLVPVILVASVAASACGKKGPPLAPLLKVPATAQDIAVRRAGNDVDLQLRVPAANSDNTRPADIRKVEIYGFTGGALPGTRELVKYGTLIAAIPVRKPAEEEEPRRRGEGKQPRKPGEKAQAAPERPPSSMANGFDQGDLVTVREELGTAQLTPVVLPVDKKRIVPDENPWRPILLPDPAKAVTRQYFVVGVNHKAQRGGFSPAYAVPLGPAPPAPDAPLPVFDEKNLTLWWTPPPGVPRPVQEPADEGTLASTPRAIRSSTTTYNVYAVPAEQRLQVPPSATEPVAGALPKPLNAEPLAETSFTGPVWEWGKERCFAVSTVVDFGGQKVESAKSPEVCVTPADTFPPAPPKGVSAVGSEGAISLIWEGSAEPDVVGYLVLRREPGARGFAPLTREPIKETTFRDTTAAKGTRYAYVVVAVDAAGNRSAPSEAVEESAR